MRASCRVESSLSRQKELAMHWQVQEAKQRFSEVLRAAESGEPQIVTKHGEEVAVVIDIAEYRRLRGESMTFMEYLRAEPSLDGDLEIERVRDLPRDVDLAG
jgi:prevent-host-death family protein